MTGNPGYGGDSRRRTAGRPRKNVYVSGVRYAQSSVLHDSTGTPRVITTFSRAGGPAGLAGREAVVIITHSELGAILGAVPAQVIPARLQRCYVDVIRWLEKGLLA
jgi:hypothetical protein